MTERKSPRPRIDTVLKAIDEGIYDDSLTTIGKAVRERLDLKREEVMELVREVYGPDAKIVTHDPPVYRRQIGKAPDDSDTQELDENVFIKANEEDSQEPQSKATIEEEEDGEGYVSRSPLIQGGPPAFEDS